MVPIPSTVTTTGRGRLLVKRCKRTRPSRQEHPQWMPLTGWSQDRQTVTDGRALEPLERTTLRLLPLPPVPALRRRFDCAWVVARAGRRDTEAR